MQPRDPLYLQISHRIAWLNAVIIATSFLFLLVGVADFGYWWTASGYDEPIANGVRFSSVRVDGESTCVVLKRPLNGSYTIENGVTREVRSCYLHGGSPVRDVKTDQWVPLPSLYGGDHVAIAETLGIPEKVKILDLWEKICTRSDDVVVKVVGMMGCILILIALPAFAATMKPDTITALTSLRFAHALTLASVMWSLWARADVPIVVDTFHLELSRRLLAFAAILDSVVLVMATFDLVLLCWRLRKMHQ